MWRVYDDVSFSNNSRYAWVFAEDGQARPVFKHYFFDLQTGRQHEYADSGNHNSSVSDTGLVQVMKVKVGPGNEVRRTVLHTFQFE